jgi:branched-chain amino acid transport system permease protein
MSGSLLAVALINGLLIGGVYSLTAMGLTLIFGVMGTANFAHGTFLMVGIYVAYWLFVLIGIDPYIGMFAAMALMFVFGWYVQKYLVSKIMDGPHYYTFLLTVGILIFIENTILFLWPDYRQLQVSYSTAGISITSGLRIEVVRLVAFLIAIALSLSLYYFIKLTEIGKTIRATSQNPMAARVVGINVPKIYCITFAIGSACAGAAGAVISPFYPAAFNIGDIFLLVAFVVVCLGGMGNFIGALIGGLIIGLAESVGTLILPGGQKQLITYGLFIAILFFRPQGLLRFGGYWQAQ